MGRLICKITCGFMVLGAFQLGRMVTKPELTKTEVFHYIDSNVKDRKDIYLYTEEYLAKTDSLFLDSLFITKQKKRYAEDYLKNPNNFFDITPEKVIKDIKKISDKTKRIYRELRK